MVKIVHLADSHLGYRAGKGINEQWDIKNHTRPYEQSNYDAFLKVLGDISTIENLDFVVHGGDMFHTPHENNPFPPYEPARKTLKKGLEMFFEKTENKVPFIYVEGNHGVYKSYDYTPFETEIDKESFPNLHYYKYRDLIEAIQSGKPLTLEFPEKKVKFYLFPYFEFKSVKSYEVAYNNWIENQKVDTTSTFVTIALAHGSSGDQTLHSKILGDLNYDYIALGHEHGMKKVNERCYFPGTLLPLNFKELYENHGYLVVNIDSSSKRLTIEKVNTESWTERDFKMIDIPVSPSEASTAISRSIEKELQQYHTATGFNAKTSARLLFNFTGEITYEMVWKITNLMTKNRRECFSRSNEYNILQLIWNIKDISDSIEDDVAPGIIEDYILKNPDEEFREFVEQILEEDKTQFQVEKLTEFGINAIKKALDIEKKEKEE
ncbi:MAG: metallophosphoesterase [Candidatus Lokiarchaeota archaeon]|nr:metallophosphoesterase [Candidatus Lokiarchaeota archaeon]